MHRTSSIAAGWNAASGTAIAAIGAVLAMVLAAPASVATPAASRDSLSSQAQRGPFSVRVYADPTLPDHSIYLPATPRDRRMPVVAWANGGCATVGNRYARLLSDLASHGMLVIAIGKIGDKRFETDPTAEPFQPSRPPKPNDPPQSDSSELTRAIDWAIAQDARTGSTLYHRIKTDRIAVMGHSCGGLQALAVAATDPRITTTILMNSGVWNRGPGGLPGADVTKGSLARLRGSIAYLSGDASDGAHDNSRDDFGRVRIPALWAYRQGTGHGGMFWTTGDDPYARVAGAWLRWHLLGQRSAARLFTGRDCPLCKTPGWTVQRKGIR